MPHRVIKGQRFVPLYGARRRPFRGTSHLKDGRVLAVKVDGQTQRIGLRVWPLLAIEGAEEALLVLPGWPAWLIWVARVALR